MKVDTFIKRHPRLFHMAEQGAWKTIRVAGLLSTTALLDLYEYKGPARVAIESERRTQIVTIKHPRSGAEAQIRDNKPLRPQFLESCLEDMTMREWYELLNRKVFFWVSEERLGRLLSARPYRSRPHEVITIDTKRLLDRGTDRITLAPINTGSTLYPTATPRGTRTFRPIETYPLEDYVRWRGQSDAIVELAVDYSVPDVEGVATVVELRHATATQRTLWRASRRRTRGRHGARTLAKQQQQHNAST